MAINAQELQGQWNKLRGQVKERWGQLTDDDLQIQGGNIDQLVGRIQQKTGEGREAIENFLSDLTSRGSSVVSQAAEAVGTYAQQAGDRLREHYGQFSDQARERYDMAQDMVRHNPAQSVAAAFGVGLVAGLIVGLALRSR
ncbi:MAG TPA: CsbD family protein [Isosphaeraceae bacterium]|nr:CsbD family protein [Isosphaeraceae bacterium]